MEDWADDWDGDAAETDFDAVLKAELEKVISGATGGAAAASAMSTA